MATRKKSAAPSDIHAFVESRREDLVGYLSALVRAQTFNPPGEEHRAAEVVAVFCKREGIPFETFAKEPGRTNLVARVGTGRPRVFIPVHFDTVPAGEGWTTDPFEPVVKNGRLYGRGAMDNKGPMAAMMLVARYLKAREAKLKGQLVLAGVADEEAGSRLGVQYLLDEVGLEAELSIVPDAGHEMRIIDIGEKGLLHFKVIAIGRQAHGSRPELGVSALWGMVDLLNRLRGWRPPTTGPSAIFTPPTMNVGAIHAGSVPNVVPGRCECIFDIRYHPGTTEEDILGHVRKEMALVEASAPGLRMSIEVLSSLGPTLVPPDNPLIELLERHTEAVAGYKPRREGESGTTVAKQIIAKGIPAVGFSCGPAEIAHQADEYIELDDLARFAEVMARALVELLT